MAQLRIFVSHSSHDNAWCRPFADALKAVGYDVWYDETGLQGGAAWVDSIQREVENRDAFLLVLTPEAWESKWVQDELQLAIATRRRILPVLLRNTQVSGFLLTTQWITVVGEEPQAAARTAIMSIEAPTAPGRNVAPQAATETLQDLITLCKSLAAEKRYTEALSACGRALALDPNNIEALRLRGWVLLNVGEPHKAIETLGRMLMLTQGEQQTLTDEVIEWIWQYVNITYRNFDEFLAPMVSQLTSGRRLRDVFSAVWKSFAKRSIPSVFLGDGFRKLASEVEDAEVVRTAIILFKGVNSFLILQLAIGYYGYAPDKATPADVDALKCFKDALAEFGSSKESAAVEQYIQRLSHQR